MPSELPEIEEAVEEAGGSEQAPTEAVDSSGVSQALVEASPQVAAPLAGVCIFLEFFLCTTVLFLPFGTTVPQNIAADFSDDSDSDEEKNLKFYANRCFDRARPSPMKLPPVILTILAISMIRIAIQTVAQKSISAQKTFNGPPTKKRWTPPPS